MPSNLKDSLVNYVRSFFSSESASDANEGTSHPVASGDAEEARAASSDMEDQIFDDFGDAVEVEETNEQPTTVNAFVIASGLGVFGLLILLGIWLIPSSEPAPDPSDDPTDQASARSRPAAPPGVDPSDTEAFDPTQWDSDSFDRPGSADENLTPQERAQRRSARMAELNRERRQRIDSLASLPTRPAQPPPRGAEGRRSASQFSGGNPYQTSPRRGASQSGSGPSAVSPQLQKAMASAVSTSMDPPGQFDPRAAGSPRHPASGRPLGQPPTPAELEKEQAFQREQQSGSESYAETMKERFPLRRDLSQDEQFIEEQRARGFAEEQTANINRVSGPFTLFVLPKGTLIPITLETGSSNELPGTSIMRVTRDIYDQSAQYVLIPRGSEVVSSYSTAAQVGQSRILLAANRLNLPDGRYLNFRDARAADVSGFAGLKDQKDRHLIEKFASVGALAVLSATVALTDPLAGLGAAQRDTTRDGSEIVVAPGLGGGSFGARATFGFSQQVSDVISNILERQIQRQPTLTLRPGLKGLLVLNEDIDLRSPYYEEGDDFDQMDARFRQYYQDLQVRQQQRQLDRSRDYYRHQETMQAIDQEQRRVYRAGDDRGYPSPPPSGATSPPTYYYQEGAYTDELPTYLPPRRGISPREEMIRRRYMNGEGLTEDTQVTRGDAYSTTAPGVEPAERTRSAPPPPR